MSLWSKCDFVNKFAFANLAEIFPAVNLLNSGVVIYLSCFWSIIFFKISLTFVSWSVFFIRLLTSGTLFSTAVNAEVVAKSLILGISVLTSFIFVLRII